MSAEKGIQQWQVSVGKERTEVLLERAGGSPARGLMLLAHGAGGNMHDAGLTKRATLLRECGLDVARFNFLYRAAHRSYPDKMPQLLECYRAVIASVQERAKPKRLFIGGHSMGGRAATMLAAAGFACDGLILFAYPLHPPGRHEQLRDAHLPMIRVPGLCFSGTRDDFARRDLMDAAVGKLPNWTQHWLEHADHGFRVPKKSGRTEHDLFDEVARAVREWLAAF